jgi:16S rRNA G966 N2-methylase RsmD/Pyruvate/2-oxoacid:ferredoxin oxidoreductase delta subunit
MLINFLNVRNSTRNLSDAEFEEILPQLAKELESASFYSKYSDRELYADWKKLQDWDVTTDVISSTQRIGMKLCEHFCPNFYDIENKHGNSFKSLWTADNLVKVLRWNRKSHSTPYLSEIKRGIYFNFGLAKSTMYRPQMAKMVVSRLKGKRVFDPCAGWGGRLLGSIAAGADVYIAFEPNTETYANLVRLVTFLGLEQKVILYNDSALNMQKYDIQNMDIVLTSPPYFDLEIYSHEDTQSVTGTSTYTQWKDMFLTPIVNMSLQTLTASGWSCWNVHNVGKMKMIDDIAHIHEQYTTKKIFSVVSSKRQTHQVVGNTKNSDVTVCYSNNIVTPITRYF